MDYTDAKLMKNSSLFTKEWPRKDIYDKSLSHVSPRLDSKTKRNFVSHPQFYSGFWEMVVASSLIHVKIAVVNPQAIEIRNIDTIEIKNKSAEAYWISKEKGENTTSKDFHFYNQLSNTHIQTAISSSFTSFNCHNITVLTASISNYESDYISDP